MTRKEGDGRTFQLTMFLDVQAQPLQCFGNTHSCALEMEKKFNGSVKPVGKKLRHFEDYMYPCAKSSLKFWQHPISIGPPKKLFDWRNPTDLIFTPDPKYFYFCVQIYLKEKPVKHISSFSIVRK